MSGSCRTVSARGGMSQEEGHGAWFADLADRLMDGRLLVHPRPRCQAWLGLRVPVTTIHDWEGSEPGLPPTAPHLGVLQRGTTR